jgi:hypothetical protein
LLALVGTTLDFPSVTPPHGLQASTEKRDPAANANEWVPPKDASTLSVLLHDMAVSLVAGLLLHAAHKHASTIIPATVAACLFFSLQSLRRVDYSGLLKAEAALVASINGNVRHHWSSFATQNAQTRLLVRWNIHSLYVEAQTETTLPDIVLIHGHSAGAAHWEAIFDHADRGVYVAVVGT